MADLISSLYGYDLSYSDDKVLETWSQDFENFRHFVGVYVVAQKYLVPTLCVETKELFCGLLENLPPHDTHSTIFARIVQHVYAGLRDEATDLREPVIAHFTEHVKDINENSVFKGLLTTFPEFAMEVTAMPMQQKHDGSGGRPGTAKKRKMIIKTGNKR